MGSKFRCVNILPLLFFLFLIVCNGTISVVEATVLFEDSFDVFSDDVNRAIWTSPDGFCGRTAIRNPNIPDGMTDGMDKKIPVVLSSFDSSKSVATLALSTYNPTDTNTPHTSFWGSEIDSIPTFSPTDTTGISFEARVRSDGNIPKGVVTSVFSFANAVGTNKDEIDFEFLSNLYVGTTNPEVLINHYTNQPPGKGSPVYLPTNIDFNDFNTFKINWFKDNIQWFINNNLIYTLNSDIPTQPMSMRLNIWAPASDWQFGYDSALQPVSTRNENTDYIYEVDWVKVSSLDVGSSVVPEPMSGLLFFICGGFLLLSKSRRLNVKL